jgi:hypothetical protein
MGAVRGLQVVLDNTQAKVRYDGLYRVVKHWEEKGQAGFLVCSQWNVLTHQVMKYAMVRLEGQEDIRLDIATPEDAEAEI